MHKNYSVTQQLVAALVALSTIALIVAGQQYLLLRSENEMLLARRALDESFLTAIEVAGGTSNPEIAQQLERKKTSIAGSYSAQATMIRQVEIRALADMVAWFVVLVTSGAALIISGRKQSKSGIPPSMPPATRE